MNGFLNTTPHNINIKKEDGDILVIYPSKVQLRVAIEEFELPHYLPGIRCITRSSSNSLNLDGLLKAIAEDGTKYVLVSSFVAEHITQIQKNFWKSQGILFFIPDSGATAVRNGEGQIDYVTQLVAI